MSIQKPNTARRQKERGVDWQEMVVAEEASGCPGVCDTITKNEEIQAQKKTGLISVLLRFGCLLGCQGQRKILKFCASAMPVIEEIFHLNIDTINFWNEPSSVIAVSQ